LQLICFDEFGLRMISAESIFAKRPRICHMFGY
jgi:hypothetical protein